MKKIKLLQKLWMEWELIKNLLFYFSKNRLVIPRHKYTEREKTVVKILKKYPQIKSFLNVGFHDWNDERKHWWIKICTKNNM